ncbi:MAG: hypothetical protein K2N01_07925 [Lachnospiraceae bacterium]|nr:hypothetical protein [Lachnospiraceae bacterium]
MPKIDLTISISVIVALCAIISPMITTIINNRHQVKIKHMEHSQQKYEDTALHYRNVYENYLKHAGRCIYYSDNDALKDYGEYYYSALMYAPSDIRTDMIKANELMLKSRFDEASALIEELTAKIHAIQ